MGSIISTSHPDDDEPPLSENLTQVIKYYRVKFVLDPETGEWGRDGDPTEIVIDPRHFDIRDSRDT